MSGLSPHISPSLISLMVSVDVKRHVYVLTYTRCAVLYYFGVVGREAWGYK